MVVLTSVCLDANVSLFNNSRLFSYYVPRNGDALIKTSVMIPDLLYLIVS